MNRKKFFKHLASIIFLIFVVNFLANKFYWYSFIWYFDMPMHFLGGFWIGLVSFYFYPLEDNSLKFIFKILLFVLFLGVGWEVFEILFSNIIAQNPFNTLDTISDIFFDLSGGTFAILYFLKRIMFIGEKRVQ